ncbi:hypothetical protein SAMN04487846_2869 [Microbacterium sp. cf046]|uniref:CocE/NonD family hydrolase n=1 Tax=Microbacterium sp. cf046 TaxID=1761803 RepID=UPI0008EC0366|nr:CocE/NonD family hydrolase [Microbacterium sp. cf046]SFS14194.1 hypothetical protein SAMN04487846_2869 [Microbacterium sp. cf046]
MPDIQQIGPAPISPLAVEEFVRMRDGVRLATDVYLPGGDASPGDTILIRLPYDKSGEYTFIPLIAEYFMARGYRVVAQDVRGKFRSEGETLLFVNEAYDGYDTIDWIVNQRWSNGRVAMWGDSYYGYTQWAAVSSRHPALRAIAPRVTGTRLGEPVHRSADAAVTPVEWAVTYLYAVTYFHAQDAYFWDLDWTTRPFSAQVEAFFAEAGGRSISYDQWYPRAVHLRRFPAGHPFDAPPVPTLQTIGWWDNCAPLSWADVADLEARPAWAANHWLRIESMDHESYYLSDPPEHRGLERTEQQLRDELPRMLEPTLEFFEVFVRGNGRPGDIPRVAWNLAGTEGMRTAEAWPPPGARPRILVATAAGSLAAESRDAATEVTWTHDPSDPVPSSAGNAFAFLQERPDEAPIGDRADVLVFTSSPVARTIDLVGPVCASATVSSDGACMDVFVRLLDLAPDGTALRIARGQVHVVDASSPVEVEIDMGQLGYRLAEGHSLRVHISGSDAPEFIPLPGTGEEPWGAVGTQSNTHRITVGGADGLAVKVSVLEEEA